MDEIVGVDLLRMYDLTYLVHKACEILPTTEDWELKADFDHAETAAEMEGAAFEHHLKDVPDAFGFAVGAEYRDWFYHNGRLLQLYRRLEDGGDEFQGRGSPFTVDEDFVSQ